MEISLKFSPFSNLSSSYLSSILEISQYARLVENSLLPFLTWTNIQSDGDDFGSKIFDLGLVILWILRSGQVWSAYSGSEKFSSKRVNSLIFVPVGLKRMSLGLVKKYLGQNLIGSLLTASQKYAQVIIFEMRGWIPALNE